MKNVLKNIILIVALAAVIVIVIAIILYDFIPSGKTVAEPNIYSADTETTKVLSEIAESSDSLNSSTNGNTGGAQSNVVLKSYSITETDLALFEATGEYEPGRADPFAAGTSSNGSENTSTGDTNGGTTGGSSTNANSGSSSSSGTTESDGTLFNSTSSK